MPRFACHALNAARSVEGARCNVTRRALLTACTGALLQATARAAAGLCAPSGIRTQYRTV
eukprot:403007-Prymnesium_polylepis.1